MGCSRTPWPAAFYASSLIVKHGRANCKHIFTVHRDFAVRPAGKIPLSPLSFSLNLADILVREVGRGGILDGRSAHFGRGARGAGRGAVQQPAGPVTEKAGGKPRHPLRYDPGRQGEGGRPAGKVQAGQGHPPVRGRPPGGLRPAEPGPHPVPGRLRRGGP